MSEPADQYAETDPGSVHAVWQRILEMHRTLDLMARRLDAHVALLEQLTRDSESSAAALRDARDYLRGLLEAINRLADAYEQLTKKEAENADNPKPKQ